MLKPKYILRLMLAAVMLLLAVAPAMAQTNSVYAGQTSSLGVVEIPGDTYEWELYNDATGVNFASDPGNCLSSQAVFEGGISNGPVVQVKWLSPGTYFYKVTSQRAGCTMNLKVGTIVVDLPLPTADLRLTQSSICIGQSTNIETHLTGTAPWSITYRITYPDATIQDITLNSISDSTLLIPFTPLSAGTYLFEVISITDAVATSIVPSNIVTLTVYAKPGSSHIYQYDPLTKKKK